MKCDNYCPRCGEPEESVTHAIFEYPPALQVWLHSSTPTNPDVFPAASIYTNMNYLFWEKNGSLEPEQDRDPYHWLIWYIWKARNDKLFRGIDRDPLELVRYAESECQAWFNANETIPPVVQGSNVVDPQWEKYTTHGITEFPQKRISSALRSGSTAMGDGEYASAFNMSEIRNRLQRIDYYDQGTACLAKFCYGTREDRDIAHMLPGFRDFLYS
ncbi:uncharacterized protein LOC130511259 [Raphanus sativus]|uniref:Uncharacterized protein LOC130511259 n=1 Tax=Raphanus sativus TaxID=3726 RepID=A0A9W3DK68_RAPSA|nr:uncharacterized protein LOC130511259 [Raphanus sativus]